MNGQKHKRKESFSILLISHTGQENKQFHISSGSLRLFVIIPVLILAVLVGLVYTVWAGYGNEKILRGQINTQAQTIRQLEEEKEALSSENLTLVSENEALRGQVQEADSKEGSTADGPKEDPAFPNRYPSSETGMLAETYSEDHPYLSISMQAGGNIVAAGDGTVASVGSDDTYPLIIEIEHGNGYRTRYMCRQDVADKPGAGTQVHAGDTLVTIEAETAQLDYQVILDDQPIDPLIILDAKG